MTILRDRVIFIERMGKKALLANNPLYPWAGEEENEKRLLPFGNTISDR
jgi:hypothetical protein